jgi:hypothetical protein
MSTSRAAKIVTTIVRDSPVRNLRSSVCDARSEQLPGLDSRQQSPGAFVDRGLHVGRREGDARGIGEVIAE